ncbi:LpxI family protein [Puniceicoccales bacterium CK1056]|uniref:LpxI family protein n=1 Tax=Oceanipulchritudo coccoides TaxID=2706888 RepID=A0A6B2M7H2_9BACT|nr:UDP-2,3-diacylglucosamine diphosphatase LpxI [Oceanipulchritudo coccoides]NDV63560.1 LpxI family protein [Oceanipulchritudo coccoides]
MSLFVADCPTSRFLPESFDPSKPVAVIAGQRDYPVLTVESIRAAGLPVRLIALKGETQPELIDSFPDGEREVVKVGQIGKMLKALQKLEAGYALFVGQVSPGKLFRDLSPDIKALAMLASLKERNAHTIFGSITAEIERIGVNMLDARAFLDGHLSSHGLMTPGKQQAKQPHIDFGIRIAREVAALDIGQGVVVRKGTVLAVEAFEGTDDMLSRANKYKTDQLIFVKCAKPDQNPHFDWPVFGEKTLESMQASGIKTAALESDKVVMLNKVTLLQKASEAGIELIGY